MVSLIITAAVVIGYLLVDLYRHERVRKPVYKEIDEGLTYLYKRRSIVRERVARR